jgi:hypothetical protein
MLPVLLLLQHFPPVLQPFLLILQPILFVLQLILFLLQPNMLTVPLQMVLFLLQPNMLSTAYLLVLQLSILLLSFPAYHATYPAPYAACLPACPTACLPAPYPASPAACPAAPAFQYKYRSSTNLPFQNAPSRHYWVKKDICLLLTNISASSSPMALVKQD